MAAALIAQYNEQQFTNSICISIYQICTVAYSKYTVAYITTI